MSERDLPKFHEDFVYKNALERAATPSRILDDLEPLDEMEPCKKSYREAARRGLSVLNGALAWIFSSKNPRVATAQVAFASGSAIFNGECMEAVGARLGCSRAALSKGARLFAKSVGIEPTGALKRSTGAYRSARIRSIQRANQTNLKTTKETKK